MTAAPIPSGGKRRTIYTADNQYSLPGQLVRNEGDPAGADIAVNQLYDGLGATYDLFFDEYGRNSLDDRGHRLIGTVHYGDDYANAFFNGAQMVFGDGDGDVFGSFTSCIDIIGHELTHGVVDFGPQLVYERQPGALNEHFADVFGSLVKQRTLHQSADVADWLIGAGLLGPTINGVALRSMRNPGTAYDDPRLGKDPQPAHMHSIYNGSADNYGVHINSGIPNRAFYLLATALQGNAWDDAGRIWYTSMLKLGPYSEFQEAADTTHQVAGALYGDGSDEQQSVRDAWSEVGLRVTAARPAQRRARRLDAVADQYTDRLVEVERKVAALLQRLGGV